MNGIVYLVGAGPGDPKLLTLRGRECLAAADVVFYDALANPKLLDWACPEAERIFVGKRADRHAVPQEELNDRLVEAAQAGKVVVRLKGGDPYLFGRGGEEAERLVAAGVPFEIVPGVTSAVAAAAYAGFPLTHREYASSVAFVTGHEDPTKAEPSVDYGAIGRAVDTVVIFMGTRRLGAIVEELREGGRPGTTPVAVVQWGTYPRQRTVTGTLDTIEEVVRREEIGAPAIIVVGEVTQLRETLRWFDRKPLFGRRILVTRARAQASTLVEQLEALGAEVIECPTIRCEPPEDVAPLDSAIAELETFDWVLFTSVNAVQFFWERLEAGERDARAFGSAAIAAIGAATAEALRERGLRPDLVPKASRSEGLLEEIGDVAGKRILLPRAAEGRDVLPKGLEAAGAEVVVVPTYRTVPETTNADFVRSLLLEGAIDAITFTSGSTVAHLLAIVEAKELEASLASMCVATIGPITTEAARKHGIPVTIEAKEATIASLVEALKEHFDAGN